MSTSDAVDRVLADLPDRTPREDVLAEIMRALADEIDVAQLADDKGKTRPASAAAGQLRAAMTELLQGRVRDGDADEAEDWSTPSAPAGAAPVRDAPKSGAGNVRARGGRGGKAAGKAADAVAAARR